MGNVKVVYRSRNILARSIFEYLLLAIFFGARSEQIVNDF